MEAASNFFIKEGIAYGLVDERIETERKFTDISGSFVYIQNTILIFCVGGRSFYYFAFMEG